MLADLLVILPTTQSLRYFSPTTGDVACSPVASVAVTVASMNDFRKHPDYVAERRRIVRTHHPDRTGNDAALIEQLRLLDQRWEKKTRLRRQVHQHRPSFVSKQTADEVLDSAEKIVGTTMDTVARGAGRVAGSMRHSLFDRIPREFRRGYREGYEGSED